MDKEQTIRTGKAAAELLNSEVFKTVIEQLKSEAFNTWVGSPTDAVNVREQLYSHYVALGYIESRLKSMSDNAKFEERKLVTGANPAT